MKRSVGPSVCRVPRPNSRMERPGKPKREQWKPITRVIKQRMFIGQKVNDQGHHFGIIYILVMLKQ